MKIKFFWKPFLWLIIICYGLFTPASKIPSKPLFEIPHFDKLVHFSLFFVFCLLLFRPFKKLNTRYYFWAPAVTFLSSLVLEFSQQYISITRNSDVYDFLANTTGILMASLFYALLVSDKKWEVVF